jgi:hypothetical protein
MIKNVNIYGLKESIKASKYPMAVDTDKCTTKVTKRTYNLASVQTGTGHDNFLKGILVQFDLTMTSKMSVELERYHFIDFVSSQSTMHRISQFNLDEAYIKYVDKKCIEIIKEKVNRYNSLTKEEQNSEKGKELYLEILYSNPCGMYLTARMTTNYQQLKTIYQQRRNHRLPEWQEFCDWIETLPLFVELCLYNNNI